MPGISAEQVGAQVHTFWNAYCNRSGHILEQLYLPSATVYGTFTKRSESARLMLARRLRKFGDVKSFVSAKLGPIDVQLAGEMAVASYPYQFRMVKTNSDGSRVELDEPYSRATQVFQADQNGGLRILHEHFSVSEPGKKVVIPRDGVSAAQPTLTSTPAAPVKLDSIGASAVLKGLDTATLPAVKPILADEVRAAVNAAWQALRSKSKDQWEAVYFPTAIFFGADVRRSEPARLALVRRIREFFTAASWVNVELSPIDVQVTGLSGAIASYTFRFHMVKQLANGKYAEIEVPCCRATVVLRRDEAGTLRIFHEHQSAVEVATYKEVPDRQPTLTR